MYRAYFVPRTKGAVVDWLVANMAFTKASLRAMPYKQLIAIYHRARRNECVQFNTST